MTFKVGDRVKPTSPSSSFSHGTILDTTLHGLAGFLKVQFDEAPSVQYNMGENPTYVLRGDFELEGDKGDASTNG